MFEILRPKTCNCCIFLNFFFQHFRRGNIMTAKIFFLSFSYLKVLEKEKTKKMWTIILKGINSFFAPFRLVIHVWPTLCFWDHGARGSLWARKWQWTRKGEPSQNEEADKWMRIKPRMTNRVKLTRKREGRGGEWAGVISHLVLYPKIESPPLSFPNRECKWQQVRFEG